MIDNFFFIVFGFKVIVIVLKVKFDKLIIIDCY